MDPNQAYLDMFAAMKDGDLQTARERALALATWLAGGGFYPQQYSPEAVRAYIDSVLRRTAGHGSDPVFSLTCRYCDAGIGLETEEDAIAQGWSEIAPALDLAEANFCGLCPDCRPQNLPAE